MKFTQIKETSLYVQDLAQSKAFYNGKLGLELIAEVAGRHVFFRAGSSVLLCFIAEASRESTKLPPHGGSGNMHIAFETTKAEYAQWKQKLAEEQIPLEQEYDWGRGILSCYFRDPDGHLLEIVMESLWD